MKIAYFINQYPKVSHSFIRREILALESQGFEVQRIALRGWTEKTPDPQDLEEQAKTRYVLRQGVLGLALPLLRTLFVSPLKLLSTLRLAIKVSGSTDCRLAIRLIRVAEACRIALWLRESGAQRLHAHFGTNSAEVAMYTRRLGGPSFSFTVHGPEEFEAPMCLSEKVSAAGFVCAISSYCRSQLYLRCDFNQWAKVQVVRCGIEPSFYRSGSVPATPYARRLVCVGRLCENKAQLLLIEAAACVRAKGIELDLVLAGDGPLRSQIESAVRHHDLDHAVRITGWISSEEVRQEILAARALVLPSFSEGLPVVLMEAMALRRPVLSTFVAGIPELVRNGESGWLFPAGSLDHLVHAIEDCLSKSDAEIQHMGDAAYARATEDHSIDVEAAKLAQLFTAPPNAAGVPAR